MTGRLGDMELDALEKIVGYGGYITKEILQLYRNDRSKDNCYRILRRLEDKGYIKKREYFISFRKPTVYQVTRKACSLYGRPEAYMRKAHKPPAIRRYLTRAHFLFLLAGSGMPVALFSSASREEFLRSKGFRNYHMTYKVNNGAYAIQMEEYILDVEPHTHGRRICFLYVDNRSYAVYPQIEALLEKYKKMALAKIAFIDFLIVTEDSVRAKQFEKVYQTYFFKRISMIDVRFYSINKSYGSQ